MPVPFPDLTIHCFTLSVALSTCRRVLEMLPKKGRVGAMNANLARVAKLLGNAMGVYKSSVGYPITSCKDRIFGSSYALAFVL
jgi:hypothetical protein